MNTNGLSPLMQAAVGGEQKVDPTKIIYVSDKYEAGDLVSEDDLEGAFARAGNDPKDYPQFSVQDYSEVKVSETGVKYVEKLPVNMGETPMGGVGETPMEMRSPYKNYQNPQDYKVFNWGNKPTPFEKRKKY